MKRIAVTLLVIVATFFNSFAQKGFHAGIGGNFNTVWIINQNSYSNDEYDYALDMGGAFRLDVGYNITNHIGFQTGFTSFKIGQKYDESHGKDLHREVKMKYSGVPIQFKFIGGKGNVKFYAMAGPQFSFLSSAEITGSYTKNNDPSTMNEVRFEKNNTGLNFGLGADISVTDFLYINAGMSFLYGFSDINAEVGSGKDAYDPIIKGSGGNGTTWRFPSPNTGTYEKSNLANGGFSVGVHYLLNKSEK